MVAKANWDFRGGKFSSPLERLDQKFRSQERKKEKMNSNTFILIGLTVWKNFTSPDCSDLSRTRVGRTLSPGALIQKGIWISIDSWLGIFSSTINFRFHKFPWNLKVKSWALRGLGFAVAEENRSLCFSL